MRRSINILGKTYTIGDVLHSNAQASKVGLCSKGLKVKIQCIKDSGLIGLVSQEPIKSWGDLEGAVPPGCGYFVASDSIGDLFFIVEENFVVRGDVKYKKKSLAGMKCRLIAPLSGDLCFVELEENVGGGGADGLGKKGHCVLVSRNTLVKEAPPKTKAKTK